MPRKEDLTVKEDVIEKCFREEALEYNGFAIKITEVLSFPDRAMLWPCGVTDYAELKRPKGGRFQKGQKEMHEKLRGMGHVCVVLDTKEKVKKWFRLRAKELGVERRYLPNKLRTGEVCATDLKKYTG